MEKLKPATVYGEAVFSLARENNMLAETAEELSALREIFHQETDFYKLLCSPIMSPSVKKDLLDKVFADRFRGETIAFLRVLIDNKRMALFDRIVAEFLRIDKHRENKCKGIAFSAVPLLPEEVERLQAETGKLLQEPVLLENQVDPQILGGVKIQIKGKMIDASLKTRLEELEYKLKNM